MLFRVIFQFKLLAAPDLFRFMSCRHNLSYLASSFSIALNFLLRVKKTFSISGSRFLKAVSIGSITATGGIMRTGAISFTSGAITGATTFTGGAIAFTGGAMTFFGGAIWFTGGAMTEGWITLTGAIAYTGAGTGATALTGAGTRAGTSWESSLFLG